MEEKGGGEELRRQAGRETEEGKKREVGRETELRRWVRRLGGMKGDREGDRRGIRLGGIKRKEVETETRKEGRR